MKIIQIRGSNGSGKTTIVRQYANKNNLKIKSIEVNGIETFISTNETGDIVVLGRYDKKTGGCDLFKNTDHVFNTIISVIENMKPRTIVFEGMIYSLSFRFAKKVFDLAKHYGYYYKAISLYTEPDVVLKRIYKRNGGKTIKENLVLDKIKSVMNSHIKLLEHGIESKKVDTTKIAETDMYKVLED